MSDVPILNPALNVQAVGFEHRQQGWVGVLITPWFISLFLLPDGEQAELRAGSTQSHGFPSGSYDFIVAHDQDVGCYQTCSLMSPVFELSDQQAAVEFAGAALRALHEPHNPDGARSPRGPEKAAGGAMSRRDFLRGRRGAGAAK